MKPYLTGSDVMMWRLVVISHESNACFVSGSQVWLCNTCVCVSSHLSDLLNAKDTDMEKALILLHVTSLCTTVLVKCGLVVVHITRPDTKHASDLRCHSVKSIVTKSTGWWSVPWTTIKMATVQSRCVANNRCEPWTRNHKMAYSLIRALKG